MVTRKAAQMGHVLPRRTPTGEVLSVASADSDEFGALTEILARTCTQLVAYLVVAFIVLSTSVAARRAAADRRPGARGRGVPAAQAAAPPPGARARPQLRPDVAGHRHRRRAADPARHRRRADLRQQLRRPVPAGPPGRASPPASGRPLIEAVGVLFSGVFVVLLVWLGTHQVISGELTIGQLISFLGYALFMIYPIQTFFEFAQKLTRALVSARRAIAIFEQQPPWTRPPIAAVPARARRPGRRGDRVRGPRGPADDRGERRPRGHLGPRRPAGPLPLDRHRAGQPATSARASRAARRGGPGPSARPSAPGSRPRDEERAGQRWGVTLGGVDLSEVRLTDVRRRDPGQRQRQPAVRRHPPGRRRPARPPRPPARPRRRCASPTPRTSTTPCPAAGRASSTSGAAGCPAGSGSGWCSPGRIATDAPVLVLVEPTSAVDAHTEARIAERVADVRRGRTHRGRPPCRRCGCTTPTASCWWTTTGRSPRAPTRTCCSTAPPTAAW